MRIWSTLNVMVTFTEEIFNGKLHFLCSVRCLFLLLIQLKNQRSSSRFKEFSFGCFVVGSPLIWKKRKISRNGHSLSFVVTRCTTSCHSLSLVVTLCHLLSPVVIGCHSFTTRCHSLYHSLSFVVTRCTTRCHSMYHSSVFL